MYTALYIGSGKLQKLVYTMKWYSFENRHTIVLPPPKKNMKGSTYPYKKLFLRSIDIMKHSAKYEHCGIIESASNRYSLFRYRGI